MTKSPFEAQTHFLGRQNDPKGREKRMRELRPQLLDSLKTYSKAAFLKDVTSGIIVAIIALPLSIALALASGVSP